MPNVDKGPGAVETYSCPCPALPEGMVVVSRRTLQEALLSCPPGETDGKQIKHHWWWDELRAALDGKEKP